MIAYIACTILLMQRSRQNIDPGINPNHDSEPDTEPKTSVAILAFLCSGLVFHAANLINTPGLNALLLTDLGSAVSTAGFTSALFYLIILFAYQRSVALGLIIVPIAILSIIASTMLESAIPSKPEMTTQIIGQIITQTGWHINWHVALSIPTYGILCLAFAQACLLIIQEKRLQQPLRHRPYLALPALQTMELSLFWLTLSGFVLMTLNLLLGMASSLVDNGQWLEFNHHIVLSIAAWAGFGCLLAGRKIAGWRGEIAARWTIGAFATLMLAYFGTRVVKDLILST